MAIQAKDLTWSFKQKALLIGRAGPILIDKARLRSNYSRSGETIVDRVILLVDEQIN